MTIVAAIQWACFTIFCVTALLTLVALGGWRRLGDGSEAEHRYFLRKLFNALVLEVVVAVVAFFGGSLKADIAGTGLVPKAQTVKTPTLPPEADAGFTLLRDVSMWDLRGWKDVGSGEQNERVSPAHYVNYLHLRRNAVTSATYVAHYQTGGAAIDLRCITHGAKIYEKQGATVHGEGHEYAIEADVSSEPLNQEFLLVIEGTYWNGFQGSTGSVETYTDQDIGSLGELATFVLFPGKKPFNGQPDLFEIDSASGQRRSVREPTALYVDKNGQFLYWNVTSRRPGKHYQVEWKW